MSFLPLSHENALYDLHDHCHTLKPPQAAEMPLSGVRWQSTGQWERSIGFGGFYSYHKNLGLLNL